jgi:hypothetical protein
MAEGPRQVQTGSVGATPVMTDVTNLGSAVPIRVLIGGTDYIATSPPGFPVRPANTGALVAEGGTFTFSAGQTYAFLNAEATALVSGGYGILA